MPRRQENASRRGYGGNIVPSDWICTICGCINFARRTSCFQVGACWEKSYVYFIVSARV